MSILTELKEFIENKGGDSSDISTIAEAIDAIDEQGIGVGGESSQGASVNNDLYNIELNLDSTGNYTVSNYSSWSEFFTDVIEKKHAIITIEVSSNGVDVKKVYTPMNMECMRYIDQFSSNVESVRFDCMEFEGTLDSNPISGTDNQFHINNTVLGILMFQFEPNSDGGITIRQGRDTQSISN